MIIPNTLLDNYYEEEVRKALLNNYIYEINDLSDKVFDTAVVHSMIFAFGRERRNEYKVRVSTSNTLGAIDTMIPKTYFFNQPQFTLSIRSYEANDLMMKLRKNSIRLCEVLDIRQAIKSGNDKLYITKSKGTEGNYHPILRGKDIKRYSLTDPHLYLLYGKHLACPRSKEIFEQPKILIREAGAEITATYDDNNYYIMSSLYNAILRDQSFSLKYLLGLINSRLFQYIMYKLTFEKTKGAFTKAKIFHYYGVMDIW
jgi:reticulocyte binding protein